MILSSVMRFADYLYGKAKRSLIGSALSYYPEVLREEHTAENSFEKHSEYGVAATDADFQTDINTKKKSRKKLSDTVSSSIRNFQRLFAKSVDQSLLVNLVRKFVSSLLYLPMRSIGIATCSFGMYTLLMSLIRYFLIDRSIQFAIEYIIAGIVLVTISMPMLVSTASLAYVLVTSRTMNWIIFRVCGIRYDKIDITTPPRVQNNWPFLIGMLLGLLSFFVSPIYIALAIIAAAVVYLIVCIPECGILLLFLTLPFVPTMAAAALNIFTALCYFIKLMRGKRLLKFERIDIMIAIYAVIVLFGGIFSVTGGSFKPSLLYVSFICGYFVVVNTIRTGEWVDRCVGALLISAAVVGFIGLWENFSGSVATTWQDEKMFEEISGRVVSTFGNPNVLGEYLIMTLPFAIALFFMTKKLSKKAGALILCAIGGGCLIYTWSRGAWLGFLIAMLCFMLIYTKKTVFLIVAGVASLPFLPFVLPQSIINRMASIGNIADSSTSYRVNIWKAALNMINDVLLSGIGVGSEAFGIVYQKYTFSGIESAPHSHNLYFQIIIEVGIFGLFVFLIVMLLFVQSCFSYLGSDYAKLTLNRDASSGELGIGVYAASNRMKMKSRLYVTAGFAAIIAMLAQGVTDYVWYNYRVFFMFWLVMALTQAARRTAVSETVIDKNPISIELQY